MKVYVIGAGGAHKIGIARDVSRRMRALQTGSSARLVLRHEEEIADDLAGYVEAHAHWLLRERRAAGEWFKVSAVNAIAAIAAAHKAVLAGDRRKGFGGMGRPKLSVKLTTVRLSESVMTRIDDLCGKNRRGEFIRAAVERELDRLEREAAKPKKGS